MSPELKARLHDIHKTLVSEVKRLDAELPTNQGVGEHTFNELELIIQNSNSCIGRLEVALGFLQDTLEGDWK